MKEPKENMGPFHMNMPNDLKEYIKRRSKETYTTISQYVIDMIVKERNEMDAKVK